MKPEYVEQTFIKVIDETAPMKTFFVFSPRLDSA
jgi:hypothetical protein